MSKYINEFAEKWLKALESGEYEQIKGFLRDQHGFCCLGVAEYINESPFIISNGIYYYYQSEKDKENRTNGHDGILSPKTRDRLGLLSRMGDVRDVHPTDIKGGVYADIEINGDMYETLIGANDGCASFKDIAKTLREKPELFFHEIKEIDNV